MATLSAKGCFKKAVTALKGGDVTAAFAIAARGDSSGGHLKVEGYYENAKGGIKGPRTFVPFVVKDRVNPVDGTIYAVAIGWDSFASDITEMRCDKWVEGGWNFKPEFSKNLGVEVLVGIMPGQTEGRFVNPNKCGKPRINKYTGEQLQDSEGNPLFTKSYDELLADTSRWVPVSQLKDVRPDESTPTVVMAQQLYS